MISLLATGSFYLMCFKSPTHKNDLFAPMIIVFITAFVISRVFLGLFDEAIMSTLQCVAIDMDLNNGVPKFGSASFQKSIKEILDSDSGNGSYPYAHKVVA